MNEYNDAFWNVLLEWGEFFKDKPYEGLLENDVGIRSDVNVKNCLQIFFMLINLHNNCTKSITKATIEFWI